ncbi:MAG: tetratricopeptide repeat protein [Caldilineaceae bacterium]
MYINRDYVPRRKRKGFFERFWWLFLLLALGIFFYETRPQWAFTTPIIPTPTPTPAAIIFLTDGDNLVKQGKFDEAITAYKEAAFLEPTNAKPLIELSKLSLLIDGLRNPQTAYDYALKAQKLEPKNPAVLTTLARALDWVGQLQDAADTGLDSLDIAPDNADTLAVLGEIYIDVGNREIGQDYIDKALAIDPQNVMALRNQAFLYERAGDYDASIAAYDKAIAVAPYRFDLYIEKARQLSTGLGEFGLANDELKKAVEIYKAPVTLNAYGYGLYLAGDHPQAVRTLRDAVEIDPNYGPAQVNLGMALAARLNFEDAVIALEKGLELEGVDKARLENLDVLAQSLLIQETPDCARAAYWFQEALKKDETDATAINGLQRAQTCETGG